MKTKDQIIAEIKTLDERKQYHWDLVRQREDERHHYSWFRKYCANIEALEWTLSASNDKL